MYRVVILTISDKGSAGMRKDLSGPAIEEMIKEAGFTVTAMQILPDERELLSKTMQEICDKKEADLILTTGGTGFSPRDWTPEATLDIAHRQAPGFSEAMRAASLAITPKAMLSRGISVIREQTLIINLPGSPKAVRENLQVILPALEHGLDILTANATECGQ